MESEQKRLSVVIPSYNRGDQLKGLLDCLARQDVGPSTFEVIIVDDGSERPVSGIVSPGDYEYELRIVRHGVNKARAAACNTGIRVASGEVVVILDDDISVRPNLLSLHRTFHENPANSEFAAIGAVEWGTGENVSPSMYFLENTRNFYPLYPRVMRDNLPNMTTANFSIRKSHLIERGMFDESFREYGYEDIELGERLRSNGLKFAFLDGANARHHKAFTLDGVIKRQFESGKMLSLYYSKNVNASMGISSLGMLRCLPDSQPGELQREISMLAELEDLLAEKEGDFWTWPEYYFYFSRLDELLSKYNSLGMVEGFKKILPGFDNLLSHILSSITLADRGETGPAMAEIAKAGTMYSEFPPAEYFLAELMCGSGRYDDGMGIYEAAFRNRSDLVYPALRLSAWRSRRGDYGSAMGICKEMSGQENINPHWRRHVLTRLVETMIEAKMLDEAFAESMRCREEYSSDPYLQYNLASLFETANVSATAEDLFNSLLKYLDGQEDCFEMRKLRSGIHYHLGMIRLSGDQKEAALRDFSYSLRYDVAHRKSASMIHELRAQLGTEES